MMSIATIKMPRSRNRRMREIQRQKKYLESIADGIVTMGGMVLVVLCIWAATELSDWVYMTYIENGRLKQELHEEKTAFNTAFLQDALNVKRKDEERKAYVKKWQAENPKLAGIFNAR